MEKGKEAVAERMERSIRLQIVLSVSTAAGNQIAAELFHCNERNKYSKSLLLRVRTDLTLRPLLSGCQVYNTKSDCCEMAIYSIWSCKTRLFHFLNRENFKAEHYHFRQTGPAVAQRLDRACL